MQDLHYKKGWRLAYGSARFQAENQLSGLDLPGQSSEAGLGEVCKACRTIVVSWSPFVGAQDLLLLRTLDASWNQWLGGEGRTDST